MDNNLYNALTDFRNEMNQRFDSLENRFVTTDRFHPVEMIVYGMAGFVLVTVLGAIVAIVISKTSPTVAQDISRLVTPTIAAMGNK